MNTPFANKEFIAPRSIVRFSRIATTLLALTVSLRPYQWIKNSLVFGGLIFSRSLLHWETMRLTVGAFLFFCLASSGIYLLNDWRDAEHDRQHPVKRLRPLATGELSPFIAFLTMFVLLATSLLGAWMLHPGFASVLIVYVLMNFAYSFGLKKVVILDVIFVALGFVLRAIAGAVVIGVAASPWLILCTFMLAIFVSFGKRYYEIKLLHTAAYNHRRSLDEYSIQFLETLMAISGAGAIVTYALYTMAEETVVRIGSRGLVLTTPLVIYGIFRYLYLVHENRQAGDPTSLFFTDKSILANIILWVIFICFIIYGPSGWLPW